MGVERIALEHHGDVAARRWYVADGSCTDFDLAPRGFVQTREKPKQRALAATRGADQDQELAVLDRQIQLTDDLDGISTAASWVDLAEVFETDAGQRLSCSG